MDETEKKIVIHCSWATIARARRALDGNAQNHQIKFDYANSRDRIRADDYVKIFGVVMSYRKIENRSSLPVSKKGMGHTI